jgi:tRNA G37 N-methylase TrmD
VADVFDRAREEAFGKIIGHCAVQSRTFRAVVVGEAIDRSGKTTATAILEALIRIEPDASGNLTARLHDVFWH